MLAALMGVRAEALTKTNADAVLAISFALKQGAGDDRVLLRSRYATGRRFELARLLGDRLLGKAGDALYPATRSTTSRSMISTLCVRWCASTRHGSTLMARVSRKNSATPK